MERMSDIIRREFKKGDDIRDAGLMTPDNIRRWDDIIYTDKICDNLQKLDVYRPKEKKENLPVIVSVHGGGWVYGDKERYQYYCMNLAQRGFVVINYSYRLAPEWRFPAALEDTNMVFEWLLKNAENYGADTERIFAVGDSAGAHMLALYMNIHTNKEYQCQYKFKTPENLEIKAIALNCGQYHLGKEELQDEITGKLIGEYLPENREENKLDMLCADYYLTEKFPPSYIMTSDGDFLREKAPIFYKKLKKKQQNCELHEFVGKDKKLGHVFHLDIRSEEAEVCNDEECEFFRKFM